MATDKQTSTPDGATLNLPGVATEAPVSVKATRTRRTKEEIEAAKANGEAKPAKAAKAKAPAELQEKPLSAAVLAAHRAIAKIYGSQTGFVPSFDAVQIQPQQIVVWGHVEDLPTGFQSINAVQLTVSEDGAVMFTDSFDEQALTGVKAEVPFGPIMAPAEYSNL